MKGEVTGGVEASGWRPGIKRALGRATAAALGLSMVSLLAIVIAETANEGLTGLRGLECLPRPFPQEPPDCRVQEGFWFNRNAGVIEIRIISGDAVTVHLDGIEAARRKPNAKARASRAEVLPGPGLHRVRIEKARPGQWVEIVAGPSGGRVGVFGPLFKDSPSPFGVFLARLSHAAQDVARWLLPISIALALMTGLVEPALAPMALAAILLWGGLLRVESAVATRAPDAPGALHTLAGLGHALRPSEWNYTFEPYSGDPINYLRRGREMEAFYDASDREPFFVGLVSLCVRLAGGRDIGLSLASGLSSLILIAAAFRLGQRLVGTRWGLVTALLLALNHELILRSGQGWRDETFAAGVVVSFLVWLRFAESPSPARAAASGVVAAWPFLTRLSALTFIAPALLLCAVGLRAPWRERLRFTAIATLGLTVFAAPYLWSCWQAFGDPFRAINVHTLYYRSAEIGANVSRAENVGAYLFAGRSAIERVDTAAAGLMEIAFARSYDGLVSWFPAVREIGLPATALGLVLMSLSDSASASVLFLTLMASAPYAWTWSLGSGSDFRFTQHVLPIAFIGAAWMLRSVPGLWVQDARARRGAFRLLTLSVASLALIGALRLFVHTARLKSDGREGRPLLITGGFLDSALVRGFGWPHLTGGQYVRGAAHDPRLEVDLRPGTPWLLTVRWWSDSPVAITEDGATLAALRRVDRDALGFAEIPLPPSMSPARTLRFQGTPEFWWVRLVPKTEEPRLSR